MNAAIRCALRRLILPVVILGLIIVPFLLFGPWLEARTVGLVRDAGPGFMFASVVALLTADVFLPVPSSVLSLMAGDALGVTAGALAVWVGMTLGSGLGLAIGRGLLGPANRRLSGVGPEARETRPTTTRDLLRLVICRPIPVLGEASVLLAAANGMRARPLLVTTALANAPIAVIYAYFGSRFFDGVPLWMLGAALAVLSVAIVLVRRGPRAGEPGVMPLPK